MLCSTAHKAQPPFGKADRMWWAAMVDGRYCISDRTINNFAGGQHAFPGSVLTRSGTTTVPHTVPDEGSGPSPPVSLTASMPADSLRYEPPVRHYERSVSSGASALDGKSSRTEGVSRLLAGMMALATEVGDGYEMELGERAGRSDSR